MPVLVGSGRLSCWGLAFNAGPNRGRAIALLAPTGAAAMQGTVARRRRSKETAIHLAIQLGLVPEATQVANSF